MHGPGRKRRLCRGDAARSQHRRGCRNDPQPPTRKPAVQEPPSQGALPIFSLSLLSHVRAPTASPEAQITQRSGHVDNPADRVKFRRLDRTVAIALRAMILAKLRESSMAAAEGQTSPKASNEKSSRTNASEANAPDVKASDVKAWHQVVLQTLKRNDIRLVPYVPD